MKNLKKMKFMIQRGENHRMPIAIYVRCGELKTIDSDEHYYENVEKALKEREYKLRKYCKLKGYRVVKVYKDYPLSDWNYLYIIADGVRQMIRDSFNGEFRKVVFTSIHDIDSRIKVVSNVLEIISDNEIEIETINEGIMHKDFIIETNAKIVNIKKKNKGVCKNEK